MFRLLKALIFLGLLTAAALAGGLWWYAHAPLKGASASVDFTITRGSSMRAASRQAAAVLPVIPEALVVIARLMGRDTQIKAGSYEVAGNITPVELIEKLTRGDVTMQELTVPEGHSFRQFRAALAGHAEVSQTLKGLSDKEALALVVKDTGVETLAQIAHPEGLFFPDTYLFAKGAKDVDILKRAFRAMDKRLTAEWAQRDKGLPYKSAYEALIMASIVEKETGQARERPQIAGVFVNRLRRGMLLQTDPTVIYGMGENFDGNIRKRDLQTDTPYNTYTRGGLPPTPIALPGLAAIQAALHPAATEAIFFVSRGDGSHEFSATLDAHNRAVNKYQRKGG